MHRQKTSTRKHLLQCLLPLAREHQPLSLPVIHADMEAGLIAAILVVPQAIALAMLAGMPPEYGLYTSIFPVIIAALWGSSWHTLSGPNTAVCVLLAVTVSPLAIAGTENYIGYVLLLTLMAGTIQLAFGLFRLAAALNFISNTIIVAVIQVVALFIIVSAMGFVSETQADTGGSFFHRVYALIFAFNDMSPYSLAVLVLTITSGWMARQFARRYALIIALIAGTLLALLLEQSLASESTGLHYLGVVPFSPLPLSAPNLIVSFEHISSLLSGAVAIAFLGLMQTIVISRSLAMKSGQHIDATQEVVGQGLSNLVAPFFSSFAGSGSFNRSAAHQSAGAKTPWSAVYAAIILILIMVVGVTWLAYLPLAAIAGVLVLVGVGLLSFSEIRAATRSRQELLIFLATAISTLCFGLTTGVLVGVILSLGAYLWFTSQPNVSIEEYPARDGRIVQSLAINGNLFFGSVGKIERVLVSLRQPDTKDYILLIRTDHLSYMDLPGASLLQSEVQYRQNTGGDCYIYVSRSDIQDTLKLTGLDATGGGQANIILKAYGHPMKHILSLYTKYEPCESTNNKGLTMDSLLSRLRSTRLLNPISEKQLTALIESSEMASAGSGDIILQEGQQLKNHIVLLEGELECQKTWTAGNGEKSHTRIISPESGQEGIGFVSADSKRLRIRALSAVRYLLLDADQLDTLLGWSETLRCNVDQPEEVQDRMRLVRHVGVFHHLPIEHVRETFERMQVMPVSEGQEIINQGDEGDLFYIIEDGEAEIIRTDPFTDETAVATTIGPGDAFGEEALLQEGYRNATVRMLTPGQLLTLSKGDFNELIKPNMVDEITAQAANEQVQSGSSHFIDCRYDMEYEDSRIPGAQFISLTAIRSGVIELNPERQYIVYCRSGRRSKAGAFLLRERNIQAVSLIGGIKDWPYDIEEDDLQQEPGH